uniref:Uncharacterized protein n=1 Tax=Moschus moschiferus TaxID=68415 RepID=A0A8C6CMZ1_MOSMO
MLRRAEPCERVVSVAKARPGLASVQTEEAAIDGIIINGLGYCLKITAQILSCVTNRHRRGWPSSWGNLCHQYRKDKVIANVDYDHRGNNDQGLLGT